LFNQDLYTVNTMDTHHTKSKLVYSSLEPQANIPGVQSLGGKGYNLALLSKQNTNVPCFVVLNSALFEQFLGESIQKIDHILLKLITDPSEIESVASHCQKLINEGHFCDDLVALINNTAGPIIERSENNLVAVRSSAIDEDSKNHSFAGQMDSFLYVKAGEQLMQSIKDCFCSAFSVRCLSYRLENKLHTPIRPAVVIQQMITGDVSGVLFTGNPLNNNLDEMVINATLGLGEGIVSGLSNADMWVIDENDDVTISQFNDKTEKVIFDHDRGYGTKTETIAKQASHLPTLNASDLKSLVKTGKQIENFYDGVCQDIEWTIRKGKLYILQSRPISTLSHISKNSPRTILDNSNIVESFSGVTSPLTFSFASRVYDKVYQQYFSAMGIPRHRIRKLSSSFSSMLTYFNGHIYYNLNSWYKTLSLLPFYTINKSNLDLSIGVQTRSNIEKNGATTRLARYAYDIPLATFALIRIACLYLTRRSSRKRFINRFNKVVNPYLHENYHNWSNQEISEAYHKMEDVLLQQWKCPIINDFFAETFYGLLTKLIRSSISDLNPNLNPNLNIESLQNDLLCGQGQVESLKPTTELMAIAKSIKDNIELHTLFVQTHEDELNERILCDNSKFPQLKKRINLYIMEYGYRCVNELKLEEKTIKDEPKILFRMLKNYLKGTFDGNKLYQNDKSHIRLKAQYTLQTSLDGKPLKKRLAKWLVENTQEHIQAREELRFCRTKVFAIVRNIMNAYGKNLSEKNLITAPSDIYYLTITEIMDLLDTKSANVGITKDLVQLRKSKAKEQLSLSAPVRIHMYGDQNEQNYVEVYSNSECNNQSEDSGLFVGTACCPGVISGKIKVLHDFKNIELNGEIIVAKRTDPGWVTLFPCISGLIVERGSVLSHSAVVAREMGIPTVVGIRGITDKLKDGDEVEINGSEGNVRLLHQNTLKDQPALTEI
jgi:rifampicin phosphotransferase